DSPKMSEIHFGQRIALHGNLMLISAYRDGLGTGAADAEQGAFYVYTRPGAGQPFTLAPNGIVSEPNPAANARFGYFVATNGTFVAAGRSPDPDGIGNAIQIFTLGANGTVSFSYSIDPGLRPKDLAMTESGVLVLARPDAGVLAYRLQPTQA